MSRKLHAAGSRLAGRRRGPSVGGPAGLVAPRRGGRRGPPPWGTGGKQWAVKNSVDSKIWRLVKNVVSNCKNLNLGQFFPLAKLVWFGDDSYVPSMRYTLYAVYCEEKQIKKYDRKNGHTEPSQNVQFHFRRSISTLKCIIRRRSDIRRCKPFATDPCTKSKVLAKKNILRGSGKAGVSSSGKKGMEPEKNHTRNLVFKLVLRHSKATKRPETGEQFA